MNIYISSTINTLKIMLYTLTSLTILLKFFFFINFVDCSDYMSLWTIADIKVVPTLVGGQSVPNINGVSNIIYTYLVYV